MEGPQEELGRGIAAVLRIGTVVAVVAIAGGLVIASVAGGPGPGPSALTELLRLGGGDAFIGAGMLALTLTPPAALVVAAFALRRAGERSRAVTAVAVFMLLIASLVAAALIGAAS